MTATYGPPRPADQVAALLRRRGVNLDPERLDERLAAERAREKRVFADYRDQVETLASVVKKARRLVETEKGNRLILPQLEMLDAQRPQAPVVLDDVAQGDDNLGGGHIRTTTDDGRRGVPIRRRAG